MPIKQRKPRDLNKSLMRPKAPDGFHTQEDGSMTPAPMLMGHEPADELAKIAGGPCILTFPNLMETDWSVRPYYVQDWFGDVDKLAARLNGKLVRTGRQISLRFPNIHMLRTAHITLQRECGMKPDQLQAEGIKMQKFSAKYAEAQKVMASVWRIFGDAQFESEQVADDAVAVFDEPYEKDGNTVKSFTLDPTDDGFEFSCILNVESDIDGDSATKAAARTIEAAFKEKDIKFKKISAVKSLAMRGATMEKTSDFKMVFGESKVERKPKLRKARESDIFSDDFEPFQFEDMTVSPDRRQPRGRHLSKDEHSRLQAGGYGGKAYRHALSEALVDEFGPRVAAQVDQFLDDGTPLKLKNDMAYHDLAEAADGFVEVSGEVGEEAARLFEWVQANDPFLTGGGYGKGQDVGVGEIVLYDESKYIVAWIDGPHNEAVLRPVGEGDEALIRASLDDLVSARQGGRGQIAPAVGEKASPGGGYGLGETGPDYKDDPYNFGTTSKHIWDMFQAAPDRKAVMRLKKEMTNRAVNPMEDVMADKPLIPGGRTDLPDPADVDPDQLARGIEVEHEHTTSDAIAEEIGLAHLQEMPDYYTRLDKMEGDAKGDDGMNKDAFRDDLDMVREMGGPSVMVTRAIERVYAEPRYLQAASADAQAWISKKIKILMDEGKPQDQAVAIAYSMARDKGYDVPEKRSVIIKQAQWTAALGLLLEQILMYLATHEAVAISLATALAGFIGAAIFRSPSQPQPRSGRQAAWKNAATGAAPDPLAALQAQVGADPGASYVIGLIRKMVPADHMELFLTQLYQSLQKMQPVVNQSPGKTALTGTPVGDEMARRRTNTMLGDAASTISRNPNVGRAVGGIADVMTRDPSISGGLGYGDSDGLAKTSILDSVYENPEEQSGGYGMGGLRWVAKPISRARYKDYGIWDTRSGEWYMVSVMGGSPMPWFTKSERDAHKKMLELNSPVDNEKNAAMADLFKEVDAVRNDHEAWDGFFTKHAGRVWSAIARERAGDVADLDRNLKQAGTSVAKIMQEGGILKMLEASASHIWGVPLRETAEDLFKEEMGRTLLGALPVPDEKGEQPPKLPGWELPEPIPPGNPMPPEGPPDIPGFEGHKQPLPLPENPARPIPMGGQGPGCDKMVSSAVHLAFDLNYPPGVMEAVGYVAKGLSVEQAAHYWWSGMSRKERKAVDEWLIRNNHEAMEAITSEWGFTMLVDQAAEAYGLHKGGAVHEAYRRGDAMDPVGMPQKILDRARMDLRNHKDHKALSLEGMEELGLLEDAHQSAGPDMDKPRGKTAADWRKSGDSYVVYNTLVGIERGLPLETAFALACEGENLYGIRPDIVSDRRREANLLKRLHGLVVPEDVINEIEPFLKARGRVKTSGRFIPAGTRVRVEPTGSGLRDSYPAANWLSSRITVTLLDDAPNAGTLDVLDVRLDNGIEKSVYDFNILGMEDRVKTYPAKYKGRTVHVTVPEDEPEDEGMEKTSGPVGRLVGTGVGAVPGGYIGSGIGGSVGTGLGGIAGAGLGFLAGGPVGAALGAGLGSAAGGALGGVAGGVAGAGAGGVAGGKVGDWATGGKGPGDSGSFRQKLEAEGTKIDENGVIRDPGKFEGEWFPVVYFYEARLNGDGDSVVDYGDGGGVNLFTIEQKDLDAVPELAEHYKIGDIIGLEETDLGFVGLPDEPEGGWDKAIADYEAEHGGEDDGGYGRAKTSGVKEQLYETIKENIKSHAADEDIFNDIRSDEYFSAVPEGRISSLISQIRGELGIYMDEEEREPVDMQPGDLVDFGAYGQLYYVGNNRATDLKEERFNPDASGWGIGRLTPVRILERGADIQRNSEDEEDGGQGRMKTSGSIGKWVGRGIGFGLGSGVGTAFAPMVPFSGLAAGTAGAYAGGKVGDWLTGQDKPKEDQTGGQGSGLRFPRVDMSPEEMEIAKGMYAKGYRFAFHVSGTDERWQYAKSIADVGPFMRMYYPNSTIDGSEDLDAFFLEDGQTGGQGPGVEVGGVPQRPLPSGPDAQSFIGTNPATGEEGLGLGPFPDEAPPDQSIPMNQDWNGPPAGVRGQGGRKTSSRPFAVEAAKRLLRGDVDELNRYITKRIAEKQLTLEDTEALKRLRAGGGPWAAADQGEYRRLERRMLAAHDFDLWGKTGGNPDAIIGLAKQVLTGDDASRVEMFVRTKMGTAFTSEKIASVSPWSASRQQEARPRLMASHSDLLKVAADVLRADIRKVGHGLWFRELNLGAIVPRHIGPSGMMIEGELRWNVQAHSIRHKRGRRMQLIMPVIAGEPQHIHMFKSASGESHRFATQDLQHYLHIRQDTRTGRAPNPVTMAFTG